MGAEVGSSGGRGIDVEGDADTGLQVEHSDDCLGRNLQPGALVCYCGRPEGGGDVSDGRGDANRSSGFLHWQVLVTFARKVRLRAVRDIFGPYHAEVTRSSAANDYVWKDETAISGTRFELGSLPINRGGDKDWAEIKCAAQCGRLDDIPADVFVRNYNSLKRIAQDYLKPLAQERSVNVYWGKTGVGKSRRAWSEAGLDAYPKDPRTKFWDGYRNHQHVVMDEFRGDIDIAHILRWFDRYPVNVEVKGSSVVLNATRFWITTNLDPEYWYPNLDAETKQALFRRLNIEEIVEEIVGTQ